MKTLVYFLALTLASCHQPNTAEMPLELETPTPEPAIPQKRIASKRSAKKDRPFKMNGMIIGARYDYWLVAEDGDRIKVLSGEYHAAKKGEMFASRKWQ